MVFLQLTIEKMKIKLRNLGPLYEYEFDLDKDLHLIYGKNNIGKSHAISVVYLILKKLLDVQAELSNSKLFEKEDNLLSIAEIVEFNRKFKSIKKIGSINVDTIFHKFIPFFFENKILPYIRKSIFSSFPNFDNLKNKFNLNGETIICLDFVDYFIIEISLKKDNTLFVSQTKLYENSHIKISKAPKEIAITKGATVSFGINGNSTNYFFTGEALDEQGIISLLTLLITHQIKSVLTKLHKVYFLPASRSGLYQGLSAFSLIIAELSQVRMFLPNFDIKVPALSEPVSDYFLNLSSINKNGSSKKNNPSKEIAQNIEKDILTAEIDYNASNRKIEYFNKTLGLRLDLSETSSMVAEMAPIVAFLKYIIQNDDSKESFNLLFIEEPEAHLHPELQVKLMEFFAEMATNHIKVVMTTHSDFMFNELTNLILADKIKPEQISSVHLVMTEKGSLDRGDMKATSEGIDDFNFVEVTEDLYEERMRLLELKNHQQNGTNAF